MQGYPILHFWGCIVVGLLASVSGIHCLVALMDEEVDTKYNEWQAKPESKNSGKGLLTVNARDYRQGTLFHRVLVGPPHLLLLRLYSHWLGNSKRLVIPF